MKLDKCGDCGVEEGNLHRFGCDMEICPLCGDQLISCPCAYEKVGGHILPGSYARPHGLTQEQEDQFLQMLEAKGRIPHILEPVLCDLCGLQWPEFFHVPDEEWQKYVIPPLQEKVLCMKCYENQKKIFPTGWRECNKQRKAEQPTLFHF